MFVFLLLLLLRVQQTCVCFAHGVVDRRRIDGNCESRMENLQVALPFYRDCAEMKNSDVCCGAVVAAGSQYVVTDDVEIRLSDFSEYGSSAG